MFKIPSFILNLLNGKQGEPIYDPIHDVTNSDLGSLLLDVEQCMHGIDILERGSRIQNFTRMADIGISNDATFSELCANFPAESILVVEAFTSSFPNMNVNPTVAGRKLSGTLIVSSAWYAGQRLELTFYSTEGVFRRRVETSASSQYQKDSGWVQMNSNGLQMEITASEVTTLGNLLSNLREPGEYVINGTNMALFTDNPYNVAGVYTRLSSVTIKRMSINRGVLQEVSSVFGYPVKMLRTIDSDGTISTWRPLFVADVGFTTNASFTAGSITATEPSTFRHLNPHQTATDNLGGSSLTWNNLYVQNAPVVVSDREHKTEIGGIPDAVLDAWALVNYSRFKMKAAVEDKGTAARYHVGVIAQEIRDAFESVGLDATQYGILCHEEWDAVDPVEFKPAVYDEASGELTSEEIPESPGVEAGEIWMVRMEECLALEAALMRREVSKIKSSLFS